MKPLRLAAALAFALVTPCLAQTPMRGGTLNVAMPDDAKSLDPTIQINFTERQPEYLIYNTLVGLKPDFSFVPELAETWDLAADGRRLTFHLRDGVTFHDGTKLDAEAVRWNLAHRLDPSVKSPSRTQLADLIASVEVTDSRTVAITLKAPAPSLLGMLAQREGFIVSPTAATKYGDSFGLHPVGSGPFIFKEWVQGSRIVLDRNPDYWEPGKPYLDHIVFIQTQNPAVGVPRLMTRELDFIAALSPTDARPLENRAGIKLARSPGNRWMSLQLRWDRPPFNDPRFREAIAHAVNRKRMVDIVMNGKADIAEGSTPPGLWWFDPALRSYDFDPAKSRALLADAKLENTEIAISTQPVALYQQVSQLVQEDLRAVGIKVTIQPVSVSEWYPQLIAGNINFLPVRWTQRPDPDGLLTYLFHSKSAANTSRYANSEVDSLLDRARETFDQAERTKLYFAAQRLMTQDLPFINLFFSIEFAAMRDEVQNYVWIPDEIPRFREVWKSAPR